MEERVEVMDKQQAKALKEAQRLAKEKEREELRAKRAENLAKKEQARAEKEALKHEKEAEKEKKRQVKEEAEKRKNAAIQRQAGIMNKLFIKGKPPAPLEKTPVKNDPEENAIVSAMDRVLATVDTETSEPELFRRHFDEWRKWRTSRRPKKFVTWGVRRAPKVDVLKQPKLQRDAEVSNELSLTVLPSRKLPMKLIQFDKCFRPAYYGTHSKKSNVIGPRRPLGKEPSLDYEVDSDEDWDEGESLSDVDEPEEEEKLDEDDSADDFLVPDGYFSADEGVEMDTSENQICVKNVLDSVAERALKQNCPFIIRNFSASSTSTDSDNVAPYRESCLQALEIRVLADDISIEPVNVEYQAYPEEVKTPNTGVKRRRKIELADSALPEIVQFLQESPTSQGMKKIVESLSQRFPGIPKSTLTSKIREVSSYTDNHWKVKEEVLVLLQPRKKISLGDAEEQDHLPVACINVMQKRCVPIIESTS